jgi:hypothetical protein
MIEGKSMLQAATEAGYSKSHARSHLYSSPTGDWIKKQVEYRMKSAMSKSAIHTDTITGSLVEIMLASPADIFPENAILQRARENGVDHLIKKLTITPTKFGDKIDLEMYSRLDAISQLRDNFGMKQEPRANTFEETRRQEVEREIDKIAASEGCDRPTAALMLKDALGADSPLIATVNKYVN